MNAMWNSVVLKDLKLKLELLSYNNYLCVINKNKRNLW
nr:MAG TPA: hypothetical protein [Caudoviricetes sp.]